MRTILCCSPLSRRRPDPDFEVEAEAAGEFDLISYEALVDDGNAAQAIRGIAVQDERTVAVYRGWMLKPDTYAALYEALSERNLWLVNTPDQYRTCHCLPSSYAAIAGHTMRTVWVEMSGEIPWHEVRSLTAQFGSLPIIVKDYVKSRKHEWAEACFIPDASDWQTVQRIVSRFVELQGDDLNGGLVFREFVPLRSIGTHPQSAMPLSVEYRTFYLDHAPVLTIPYWDDVSYPVASPPTDGFPQLNSRFYTVDRALLTTGEWIVIEVGDAQVSGLSQPDHLRCLHDALAK